jgi:hypothetical protein
MISENKILRILMAISLYITSFFFEYSDDLFCQIQKIRRENYSKKIKFYQTRICSFEEWESFYNNTEIVQNSIYYV